MKFVILGLGAMLMSSSPLLAQTTTAAPAATTPQVAVGAIVSDASGAQVGTVSAVSDGTATIDTGTAKAAVPVTSFGQGPNGLLLGMTKAQLEAAVAQGSQVQFAVGLKVVGPQGNPVGTVSAISADLITVQTATTKVQLPSKAFAQKDASTLVIGMTAAQLAAAAKAAGASPPGS